MRTPAPGSAAQQERAGYFKTASGEHLYTVLHEAATPAARVLLIGPFASERHHSYLPWIRWARFLAARGVEALRFDYRGVGESTGSFEAMTFADWMEDVVELHAWLAQRSPRLPLFLHGLGLGAVFAGRAFADSSGDGLLVWAPPASAHAVLRSALLSWVTLQKLSRRAEERKALPRYLEELESEGILEVNGYRWSARLWRDSFDFTLPAFSDPEEGHPAPKSRPVRMVNLGNEASPLVRGGMGGYDEAKDFNWLFQANYDWLASVWAVRSEYPA